MKLNASLSAMIKTAEDTIASKQKQMAHVSMTERTSLREQVIILRANINEMKDYQQEML